MAKASSFLASMLGRKTVMAVTGLVGYGFVIGHMSGNLLIYLGPGPIDAYSRFLHEFLHGAGLWIARGTLLGAVVLHTDASLDSSP